ncbi:ankyrin repeat domain-containing protein [Sphingomonas sp.]|uniref:ankyrin repeat domain-containing protein n=1 Tax=Sphingomonas sp. TaxID=28214 RepID=UPI003B002D70
MRRWHGWAMMAAIVASAPAVAQQFMSDSYGFLKAVRDRDGAKVQEALDKPGSTILTSRESATGETALHIVTKRRDGTYAQVFLSRGADIDARDRQGLTPLADAAQLGWVEGVQLFLGRGARVDLADDRGETPLILATQARSLPVAKVLLDAGADPRATDSVAGMSAIDYARRDGRSEALLRMLETTPPKPKRSIAGPPR